MFPLGVTFTATGPSATAFVMTSSDSPPVALSVSSLLAGSLISIYDLSCSELRVMTNRFRRSATKKRNTNIYPG